MKTANIEGTQKNVTFKTNTKLLLRASHDNFKTAQYGADIYTLDDDNGRVLVATTRTGGTIQGTTTYINEEDYEKLLDLDDAYNNVPFHEAIMNKLGFAICR